MNDSVMTKTTTVSQKKPRKTAQSKNNEFSSLVVFEETVSKSPVPEKKVAQSNCGKKFVYFESGSGYVTKSGFKFSSEKRIYELEEDEANHLLSLSNFRLPDQLELEEYYKENK